mmetsp:Transcript_155636/g.276095  ORF Transcript_155636/g.276095 Transcript_155636/m.276095 type:complete len:92 (-) Transcript_155636:716-991(-)
MLTQSYQAQRTTPHTSKKVRRGDKLNSEDRHDAYDDDDDDDDHFARLSGGLLVNLPRCCLEAETKLSNSAHNSSHFEEGQARGQAQQRRSA